MSGDNLGEIRNMTYFERFVENVGHLVLLAGRGQVSVNHVADFRSTNLKVL